jgi:hypothetical protein
MRLKTLVPRQAAFGVELAAGQVLAVLRHTLSESKISAEKKMFGYETYFFKGYMFA